MIFSVLLVFVRTGLLNPLDSPHHMRMTDDSPFREGVVLNKPVKPNQGSYADVGLMKVLSFWPQVEFRATGLGVTSFFRVCFPFFSVI